MSTETKAVKTARRLRNKALGIITSECIQREQCRSVVAVRAHQSTRNEGVPRDTPRQEMEIPVKQWIDTPEDRAAIKALLNKSKS